MPCSLRRTPHAESTFTLSFAPNCAHSMNFYLLDAGGPALLFLPLIVLVVFMLICGLAEGGIIALFGVRRMWAAFWQGLLVNIASLIAGFAVWDFFSGYDLENPANLLPVFGPLFLLTVLVESLLLKLLNRQAPWPRVWAAGIVMNLISYGLLTGIVLAA